MGRPPGRRWILDRGGVPSRSPFWRTPEESCKGLGSLSLKINTQHTLIDPYSLLYHKHRDRVSFVFQLNTQHTPKSQTALFSPWGVLYPRTPTLLPCPPPITQPISTSPTHSPCLAQNTPNEHSLVHQPRHTVHLLYTLRCPPP